jgi:tetrahydromethanopterin S-methyltransferase subunit G
MKDTWTWFKYQIANSGVFDSVKKTLIDLTQLMSNIDLNKAGKGLGEIFTSLWKPIDLVVKGVAKLVEWTIKLSEEHPRLAKLVLGFVAFNGVMLVLSGAIMKTAGSFLIMTTSIISAYANLSMLKSLNIVSSFSGLTAGLGAFASTLGVIAGAVGLFYLAWRSNFHGIRDNTLSTLNQVKSAWADSFEYMTNKQEYLQKVARRNKEINLFGDISDKKNFGWYDSLVQKLATARALISGVFTALFGKKQDGKVLFSDAQINALRATGMLGIVRFLVMARGRAEEFTKGFVEGLTVAIGIGKKFLDFVLIPIKAIFHGMYLVMQPTINAINKIFGGGDQGIDKTKGEQQMEMFKKIGQVAGTVLGVIIGFKIVRTISGVVTSPFRALIGYLQGSAQAVDNLKAKMMGLRAPNMTPAGATVAPKPTLMQRILGTDRANRVNDVIDKYDKTPRLQPNQQREGKYQRVYGNQMYDSFYTYNVKENDQANSNQIYTKPKSRLRRMLFGDQYYSGMGADKTKAGRFGGLLNIDRDDDHIRMSAEHFTSSQRGGQIDKGKPSDYARKMIGYRKRNGDLVNYDFTNSAQQFIQDRHGNDVINPAWRKKQGEIDRIMGQINSGRLSAEYTQSRAGELRDYRSRIPNMIVVRGLSSK